MLALSLEKLAYIIIKAREFDAEVPAVDPGSGSNPTDDTGRGVLEDTRDNPTRDELIGAIASLNDQERIELLALTWFGRGDYGKDEWPAALAEARRIHDKKKSNTSSEHHCSPITWKKVCYSIEDYEIGRL
jgi:hypothetical protein